MPEPDRIARIAEATSRRVIAAALEIRHLGGDAALDAYVHRVLASLLGVAISEWSQDRAIELLAHGFQIAEGYTPGAEDTDTRH